MRYLSIKSYAKHQHYKDRRPPWIKLHVEVLDDYAFTCLQDASKAHLMLLWVLASKMDNRIPYDLPFLTRKLGATTPIDVEELVLQGFIEVSQDDGRTLAPRKQSAMPETETETETEGPPPGADAPVVRTVRVAAPSPDVECVLAHYRGLHPRKRPDEKARKAIVRALKTYTAPELCEAVTGNANDPWCQETGNQGLPYLLRDNATIDKYRDRAKLAAVSDLPDVVDGWFAA